MKLAYTNLNEISATINCLNVADIHICGDMYLGDGKDGFTWQSYYN